MSETVTYQPLTSENASLLQTADVFDNAIKPDQLAAFLAQPGHHMVLAIISGAIVGMGSATVLLHPDKSPTLFINEVGVSEAHRRRGIGTDLVRRLIGWGDAQGCMSTWLATEDDNHPARALYRACVGREQSGLVMYDWGDTSEHDAHD
ncbi:GNAT family N-acetyltransferase [Marivita hallyeonensis]|nr:GNAT family N-acetyltransferase [Marivita hallyeonensis]